MRVEKRDGYRVIVGGPVPPQADAITWGNTIAVRARSADQASLMAHELVHVRQFSELGWVRFSIRYVGSYVRFRLTGYGHMAAYRRIPLEVEASWISRLHSVRELEPNAAVLRNRLARKQATRFAKRTHDTGLPTLSERQSERQSVRFPAGETRASGRVARLASLRAVLSLVPRRNPD